MKIEIRDLELTKELDAKTMAATRGGIAAFSVERMKAGLSPTKSGTTAGTQSVCHIDGTDDGDSFGGMKLV